MCVCVGDVWLEFQALGRRAGGGVAHKAHDIKNA